MIHLSKAFLALSLAVWISVAPLAVSNTASAVALPGQIPAQCSTHHCESNSNSSIVGISVIGIVLALLGFGIYKDYLKKTAAREAGLDKTAEAAKKELEAKAQEAVKTNRWTRAELEQEALKQFLEDEAAQMQQPSSAKPSLQSGMVQP